MSFPAAFIASYALQRPVCTSSGENLRRRPGVVSAPLSRTLQRWNLFRPLNTPSSKLNAAFRRPDESTTAGVPGREESVRKNAYRLTNQSSAVENVAAFPL